MFWELIVVLVLFVFAVTIVPVVIWTEAQSSDPKLLNVVFYFIFLLLLFLCVVYGTWDTSRDCIRKEAIEAGIARWVSDPETGKSIFAFIQTDTSNFIQEDKDRYDAVVKKNKGE